MGLAFLDCDHIAQAAPAGWIFDLAAAVPGLDLGSNPSGGGGAPGLHNLLADHALRHVEAIAQGDRLAFAAEEARRNGAVVTMADFRARAEEIGRK